MSCPSQTCGCKAHFFCKSVLMCEAFYHFNKNNK
jgi:hypothetical protein